MRISISSERPRTGVGLEARRPHLCRARGHRKEGHPQGVTQRETAACSKALGRGGGDRPRRDHPRARGCAPASFPPGGRARRNAPNGNRSQDPRRNQGVASQRERQWRRIAATGRSEIRRQRVREGSAKTRRPPVEGSPRALPPRRGLRLQHGMTQEQ